MALADVYPFYTKIFSILHSLLGCVFSVVASVSSTMPP